MDRHRRTRRNGSIHFNWLQPIQLIPLQMMKGHLFERTHTNI